MTVPTYCNCTEIFAEFITTLISPFLAIQKAVEEWKAKKAQGNGANAATEDDEEDEENIYAVENDVSCTYILSSTVFKMLY